MRLPFRFGAVTLTAAAQIHLFADIETSTGRRAQGVAADMLAPKWFDKDPNKSYADNMNDLIDSAKAASAAVEAVDEARPVFDLWRIGYDAAQAWGEGRGLNELTSAYGSTLVERAIIDGLGRAEGLTYYQLLRDNHLDIDLGVDIDLDIDLDVDVDLDVDLDVDVDLDIDLDVDIYLDVDLDADVDLY